MSEPPPQPIKAVFRNGSVTVVGVIVGFSLAYLTSWASRPSPWELHDLIYDRAVRLFLIGLVPGLRRPRRRDRRRRGYRCEAELT